MDDKALPGTETPGPKAPIRWWYRLAVQRIIRLLVRLIAMSPTELGQRLTNRARRFNSLEQRRRRRYIEAAEGCADAFLMAIGDDARAYVEDCTRQRFMFCASDRDRIVTAMGNSFPDEKRKIICEADRLMSTGIPLLGHPFVADASKADWHADPVSRNRCWPDDWIDEAFAIGVADADVKYVWEVNRHQYLTTLGRAYWYSSDVRYRETALALVANWIEANPPGPGVNWCSHLEVAVRSISWMWTLPMVLDAFESDDSALRAWLRSLAVHYCHLSENLSVYTDPTNHLIGEATALWMMATCFPELPHAEEHRKLGASLIEKAIDEQNYADGVNKEQATSYHRFVLDFFIQYKVLSEKARISLPEKSDERIQAMFEFAAALAGTHGQAPMVGDSDDARGVPLLELVGWEYRDLLSTGAALYDNASWKAVAGELAPVTMWLLGSEIANRFDAIPQGAQQRARYFPDGGYCFFDNVTSDKTSELIFDCGGLGLWPNAAHGHADALSIQLRVNGEFLIGDPGTGAYFHSEAVRDKFRSTRTHNTVSIGDRDQSDILGTFKWVNPYRIMESDYHNDSICAVAVAEHNGYVRLASSVRHRRIVFSVSQFGWLVLDRISAPHNYPATRHFQFGPGTTAEFDADGQVIVCGEIGENSLILSFGEESEQLQHQLREDDHWSPQYGSILPCMSLDVRSQGVATLLTFVAPIRTENEHRITPRLVTQTLDNGGVLYTIKLSDEEARSARLFVDIETNKINNINQLETDAEAMLCVYDGMDRLERCILVGEGSTASGPGLAQRCSRSKMIASYSGV